MKKVIESAELSRESEAIGAGNEMVHIADEENSETRKPDGDFGDQVYYQANRDFVTRLIVGETILVPVGEQAQRLNGMITFNEAGAFLWEKLSKQRTKADLVYLLASNFDQNEEDVKADVSEFLEKAEERGFVIRCKEK